MELKIGDTIGFISPSSPVTATAPKRFNRALDFLTGKGFALKAGKLTGKSDYYRSGSIKERAEEINNMIRDREVRCIISTIGGYNSNSLLPYIDYEAMKKDPKIIIGYSDMTALLFAVHAKCGIPAFYGPALVATFGEFEPFNEMSYRYFEDILVNRQLPYVYKKPDIWTDEYINWEDQTGPKKPKPNRWVTVNSGTAEGRIIAGNLNTMYGIWGSGYFPEIKKGDILLIEDTMKNAAEVERAFSFLKVNGVFDKIGGLILGKHELFNDMGTGRPPYRILQEVLGEYSFPFIAEVDCSHTHPMFTIPIGARFRMDADKQELTLLDWQA